MKNAVIIGGGIQGCCAALAMANAGFRVTIFDKADHLLTRASANNEGKIHLGLVYAMDNTMDTARNMIESALHFAPGIEKLIGAPIDWKSRVSTPFFYAVHKDSDLSIDQHVEYYSKLNNIFNEISDQSGLNYLGAKIDSLWEPALEIPHLSHNHFHAIYKTEERSIDTRWLAKRLLAAIDSHKHISVSINSKVKSLSRIKDRWRVQLADSKPSDVEVYDIAINCAWDGRAHLDHATGFEQDYKELTRIKYGFILKAPEEFYDVPSVTISHGPFGDLVNYNSQGQFYVSWYPACMTWMTDSDEVPDNIEGICSGVHDKVHIEQILKKTLQSFERFTPGISRFDLQEIRAGLILGKGLTDITDPESGLHRRINNIEELAPNYYSVFTGKYTCAPFNALALQNRISG